MMPKYEPWITANSGNRYLIPGLYKAELYRRYYSDVIVGGGGDFDWDYNPSLIFGEDILYADKDVLIEGRIDQI
jgi:hypothetical protein